MRCARCGVELGQSPGAFCPQCGLPVYVSFGQSDEADGSNESPTTVGYRHARQPANNNTLASAWGRSSTNAYMAAPGGSTSERPAPPADSGWAASSAYPYPNTGQAPQAYDTAPADDYGYHVAPTLPIATPGRALSGLGVTAYAVFHTPGGTGAKVAAATPTPTPDERVVVQDALTANTLGWPKTDHCFFQDGSFHVKDNRYCYAGKPYTDARATVQATQIDGPTTVPYGIVFRVSGSGSFYGFEVYGNGMWTVWKCVEAHCTPIVPQEKTAALHAGVGQSNTLSVLAAASHFEFFINGEKVGAVDDATFTSGNIGLQAGKKVEVAFSDLSIAVPHT
jgi:hypothetical protein